MKPIDPHRSDRREFLRRAAAVSASGVAGPLALNLAAIAEAAAQSATDYKALVCVFFYGAMDNGNTLIPVDAAGYAAYSAFRTGLALPQASLAATTLTTAPANALPGGRSYALAAELPQLAALFNAGRAAIQFNVGPLMQPTTRDQYLAKSVPLPPKLFSHNDQQSIWQSNLPEGATSGWGGRIGDLFQSGNGKATFTSISAYGNAVMMSGKSVSQYQVGPTGSVPLTVAKASTLYGSATARDALLALVQQQGTHSFEREYARLMTRAIDADRDMSAALAAVPDPAAFAGVDTTADKLAAQLKIVARIIAARSALSARRQVFFVGLGGFDLHDNLLADLPPLHASIDRSLAAFVQSMSDIGVGDKVTTFTASDFGRTLASNGDGSDHGWGSHHLVLGDAVLGRRFYGTDTTWTMNGLDDAGQGRLLPSTSVDQFASSLATWFGVSATDLLTVLPRIGNFSGRPGFLA